MALLAGCGGAEEVHTPVDAPEVLPQVLALSSYEASVGTLIEAYGLDFPDPGSSAVELVFEGSFDRLDGTSEPVEFTAETRFVDRGTVRWTNFGPFHNPFSQGEQVGTFHGTVSARLFREDGTRSELSEPLDVDFKVRPSLIVRELQPVSATCNGQVTRAIGGVPYRMQVEAVGIAPETYTYTLSAPAIAGDSLALRQIASGRFDTMGDRGDFILPQVPEGMQAYGAILTVSARSVEGEAVSSSFGLQVHRPLEVYYNGNVEVAEVMAPAPVSGCIPGGEAGRSVDYTEQTTETRAKGYDLNWNESWLSSHTVAQGSQQTIGLNEQNGVGYATTDGQTFNWSMGFEVNGKVSLFELVEMGMGFNSSVGGATNRTVSQSANRTTGVNAATTTTETESITQSAGTQVGESFRWNISSSESIARGFGGTVLPQTYGVFYRQTLRLLRRAAVVAYNQCGAGQVVAEVDFYDWSWSPDLALGQSCPPLPKSNLPEAECYIPPCSGE